MPKGNAKVRGQSELEHTKYAYQKLWTGKLVCSKCYEGCTSNKVVLTCRLAWGKCAAEKKWNSIASDMRSRQGTKEEVS